MKKKSEWGHECCSSRNVIAVNNFLAALHASMVMVVTTWAWCDGNLHPHNSTRLDCRFDFTSNWFLISTTEKNYIDYIDLIHLFTSTASTIQTIASQMSHSQDSSSAWKIQIPSVPWPAERGSPPSRSVVFLGLLPMEHILNTHVGRHLGDVWSRVSQNVGRPVSLAVNSFLTIKHQYNLYKSHITACNTGYLNT